MSPVLNRLSMVLILDAVIHVDLSSKCTGGGSSSVIECLSRDRGVAGSSITCVTVSCS